MSFQAPKFTNAGKVIQSRALAGEVELKFTSIAVGSGELTTQSVLELTNVINLVKKCDITEIKRTNIDTIQLKSVFENTSLEYGFYWREVGLFVQNPEDPNNRQSDILYCYQNAGELAEYIPSASSQIIDKILCMVIAVSDAAKVSAVVKSELYVDREDFEAHKLENLEHLVDLNAHEYLFKDYNFYVSKTGSDSNLGTEESPFLTIQHAINSVPILARSAVINVASGTYDERPSIYDRKNLALSGDSSSAPVIQGLDINRCQKTQVGNFKIKINPINNGVNGIWNNLSIETVINNTSIESLSDKNTESAGIISAYGSLFLNYVEVNNFKYAITTFDGGEITCFTVTGSNNYICLNARAGKIYNLNSTLSGDIYKQEEMNGVIYDKKDIANPVGSLVAMAVSSAPSGFLPCNGSEISRATYADLFAVIGTAYGAGDGSSTFNLPLINDGKFLRGSTTAGATNVAGLPNIEGQLNWLTGIEQPIASGAFSTSTGQTNYCGHISDRSTNITGLTLDASKSNSIFGNSTTVMPYSLDVTYFIKY